AGPGKGPKGRRQTVAGKSFLGRSPDRGYFGRKMQADLRHQRRRLYRGVAAHKKGRIHGYPQTRWPAAIPIKTSQPTQRFERNLARKSIGSSVATDAACQSSWLSPAAIPSQNSGPRPAVNPAAVQSTTAAG